MDMWRDVGHSLNLRIKLEQRGKREKGDPIFLVCPRVREERKRRAKSFLLRSTEFRQLKFIGLRTKVYRIDKGYVWVSKMRDFTEDLIKEFGKSNVSGLGSVLEAS